MDTFVLILGIIVCVAGLYSFHLYYSSSLKLREKLEYIEENDRELKRTLIKGLIYRFNNNEGNETPFDFERFVANLFEKHYGGNAIVTESTGDGGIDIEHFQGEELYLGQVKCFDETNTVDYTPIAIIHSQMIKKGAKGGFIVTTSRFTENARKYAEGLDIELYDGKDLVNLWIEDVQLEVEDSIDIIPSET
ncbi:restriction endonuclease [Natranaerobius trueperi]|uniref:restriction endonuclease n=1 Tax=Natranaerobius trueperi TaxID=759412 RepID=UPI00130318D3|nr:restriction endonuclease [Natranaerobius trueperi]